jgi:ribosomal protein S18 acetylase RimI-like enzyme
VWQIDRREVIERIYYHEAGRLVLREERYDMPGWPEGEAEKGLPQLLDAHARGGWCFGLFDGSVWVGAVCLDPRWIGRAGRHLQLSFLHVSHAYRKQGWGRRLFDLAREEASRRGAEHLYISATPSENTVHFYRGLGCVVASELDPLLFELEPLDIHLEFPLGQ